MGNFVGILYLILYVLQISLISNIFININAYKDKIICILNHIV